MFFKAYISYMGTFKKKIDTNLCQMTSSANL